MPLDKPTLISDLEAIFDFESTQEESPEESRIRIANEMANAFDKYVRTGLVIVDTTGTAAAQTGTGSIT